jgi:UDP-N-acetylmuramoylalanine--D-glutamate ligase
MYLDKLLQLEKSKKIAIIGLGQENLQFLNWLINTVKFDPSRILIADQKNIDLSLPVLKAFLSLNSNIFSGGEYLKVLDYPDTTLVFKAPGIWSLKPEFESFREKHGQDSIQSSLVFFFEKYREQIIGITGTKGKSTTSSLLNHLLVKSDSVKAHYCGNTTNISPYQFWTELNQGIDPEEFFVVEVSSFQLQDLANAQISPKYGIITNYYIDHQDQHANPEEYWRAKDTVFKFQKKSETTLITQTVIDKTQTKDKLENTSLIDLGVAEVICSQFKTSLEGEHNKFNLAQAIITYLSIVSRSPININHESVLLTLNQYKEAIQSGLDSYKPMAHRQELISSFVAPITINTKTDKN